MVRKSDSSRSVVQRFIPLVSFLGTFFGENCEVVLHDTSAKEKSVLAIANGHISGRREGAPLTDLALKFVVNKEYEKQDWVMGYTTRSSDGRPLHSATYFIRGDNGELAGMMCLNMDTSELMQARDLLDKVIAAAGIESAKAKDVSINAAHTETFSGSMEELTEELIRRVVSEAHIPPERMTTAEKMGVMSILNSHGVFLLKGSIRVVAEHLVASEATIYRYLQKLNEQ
ncbi:helix-turn-helix transcriptional regulator [Pseudodesulfovibrio sp.]|uniref:helix-turn-helix transcriptional regulator n=1 Tax=unclassified Pseudodesulfovibrio TaxID=2661612 RepID=UPI003B003244